MGDGRWENRDHLRHHDQIGCRAADYPTDSDLIASAGYLPSPISHPITSHVRLLIALGLLALHRPLGAQTLGQRLQQRLDSLHRAGRFAGAQIGVALPDGFTLVATGFADTAKREAMTTRHLLLQGSVGKTCASAVALQLIHEGKLTLDDLITSHRGCPTHRPRSLRGDDQHRDA